MAEQTIYFMQHGLAVDKAEDPERPLSEAGIAETQKIAHTLRASGTTISHIYHSGKLRAEQTADIVASTMEINTTTRIAGLSPNDDPAVLIAKLDTKDALYVGHLPHLEKVTTYLVTGNEVNTIAKFQNSSVLCLEKQCEHYQIRWLLTKDLVV